MVSIYEIFKILGFENREQQDKILKLMESRGFPFEKDTCWGRYEMLQNQRLFLRKYYSSVYQGIKNISDKFIINSYRDNEISVAEKTVMAWLSSEINITKDEQNKDLFSALGKIIQKRKTSILIMCSDIFILQEYFMLKKDILRQEKKL